MMSKQVIPSHLTDDPPHALGEKSEVDAECGLFACRDCHRRITRNQSGNEYGHKRTCSHSQWTGRR